ncbi:HAD family hydrolase [Chiayiivirga flava]|uniref:FMN phosphatase YigB (HAD superfamily) n=1 Tax=Chiayiivirga flava TaxID=659595 RepID=A0A7W8D767_9GAMM|nr:HAD family hydrolase [Chiayiivirga flava]MBB5209158.1 FMN phosphatase YigB (HAD superfamily) [Chiayiivirga flava]
MRIQAIFFDAANTLLHKPTLIPAMAAALREHGVDLPATELALRHRWLSEVVVFPDRTSRPFYDDFNAHLLRSFGVPPSQTLLDAMFAACSYLPWAPFPDTCALTTLRQPLGVLSNWDNTLQEQLGLIEDVQFSWILGSQREGVRKPDAAFFRRMLDACAFAPEAIAYVGDSLRLDIEPARALGIHTFLIDRDDLFPHAKVPRLLSLDALATLC